MSSRCASLLVALASLGCGTGSGGTSPEVCEGPEDYKDFVAAVDALRGCAVDADCIVIDHPRDLCECFCGCFDLINKANVDSYRDLWLCGDCQWGASACEEPTGQTACGDDGLCYGGRYCSPFGPLGCGDGWRCTYHHVPESQAYDSAYCIPRVGSLSAGEACVAEPGAIDECREGLFCAHGACSPFCLPGSVECAEGFCLEQAAPEEARFGVCTVPCDPLAPTCGDGLSCYLPMGAGAPGCARTGATEPGDPCGRADACVGGHACADDGDGGAFTCRRICAVDGGGPACDGEETCAAVAGNTGVCR